MAYFDDGALAMLSKFNFFTPTSKDDLQYIASSSIVLQVFADQRNYSKVIIEFLRSIRSNLSALWFACG
jgi:hypothetical protein